MKRNCLLIIFILLAITPFSVKAKQDGGGFSGLLSLTDALELTLTKNGFIRLQIHETAVARGIVQNLDGFFDPNLAANAAYEYRQDQSEAADEEQKLITLTAETEKLFPCGCRLLLSLKAEHGSIEERTRQSYEPELRLNVPLLKNPGRVLAVSRQAARLEAEGKQLTLEHLLSGQTCRAASAYWSLLSAKRELAVYRQSLRRSGELLSHYRRMVELGEKTANDLFLIRAEIAGRKNRVQAAERKYLRAGYNLAKIVGITADEIKALEPDEQNLPYPEEIKDVPGYTERLVLFALKHRPDLAAGEKVVRAARLRLQESEIQKRPQADLFLAASYTGVDDDGPSGPDDVTSVVGGLKFALPSGNHAAEGALAVRYSQLRIAERKQLELARNICLAVTSETKRLADLVFVLKEREAAVAAYRRAIVAEEKKAALGMSTLPDLLLMHDKLEAAEISELADRSRYAAALAGLHHQTASLLNDGNLEAASAAARLRHLPLMNTVQNSGRPQ
ncbi:MAG: hypothetical protein CSB24_02290 [Deltaproteobacteria bacterium]|nr:MAG: hypothetical protein CSB24_02290 [Deltaproteobacteria bacterium]